MDTCDEEAGGCVADTTPCECFEDADCGDANLCDGVEHCVDNACVPGEDIICQVPANPCQQNLCQAATGQCKLSAMPGGTECDDDDLCTQIDACGSGATAGMCVGGNRVVCTVADDCHSLGVCNPLTGTCTTPERPDDTQCFDASSVAGSTSHLGLCSAGVCERLPHLVLDLDHSCAIFNNGSVRCWGRNASGELGYGHKLNVGGGFALSVAEAGALPGPPANGMSDACLLSSDGVRCWTDSVATPLASLSPLNIGASVTSLAKDGTACVITNSGGVRCWGHVLGYPGVTDIAETSIASVGDIQVAPANEQFIPKAIVRSSAVCALGTNGRIRCWGSGPGVGLGVDQVIGDDEQPRTAPVVNPSWVASDISASATHVCAISNGGVYCWGQNSNGELGIGSTATLYQPQPAPIAFDVGVATQSVACGRWHTCILSQTGRVKCFGQGMLSQLGNGATSNQADSIDEPVYLLPTIELGDVPVVQIDAGNDHTCAVTRDGAIRCWGYNGHGQLGLGHTSAIGGHPGDMPPAAVDFDL